MRHLHVHVRGEKVAQTMHLAKEYEAFSPSVTHIQRSDDEGWAIVFVNLPNNRVGAFTKAVEENVEDAQIVLFPQGVLPVQVPLSDIHRHVKYVGHRSTLELLLGALQSVGSWKGMLIYAALSGIVAAYGIIFDTIYLLVAAMLIAPMGAPAMVSVIGVSIGDWKMFARGMIRFWVAILVLVASAVAIGLLYRFSISTGTMMQIGSYSRWIATLAIAGGAAGALSQFLSERDSLVTGTATGFLVAVSLSPPAAVVGLSIVLAQWDYTVSLAYVLVLTFVGIVAGGSLILILFGVSPQNPTIQRGSSRVRSLLLTGALFALIGLITWQIQQVPLFSKADQVRAMLETARRSLGSSPDVQLIDVQARTIRPTGFERDALLLQVVVEKIDSTASEESFKALLREEIRRDLGSSLKETPLYMEITVLPHSSPEG